MKLTKAKLIKRVKPGLELLGYSWFQDSIMGSDGLFIKKLSEDYYLSLGMNIHRFYEDRYTCDYYLSLSTCINCLWGDIPVGSSRRPGELLTDEEISPSRNHDIWWSGEDSVEDFLSVIKVTEPRFVSDMELLHAIKQSNDANMLHKLAYEAIRTVDNLPNINFLYSPKKNIDNIPLKWFFAAEAVLCCYYNNINNHQVKRLAADAYRQYTLSQAVKR